MDNKKFSQKILKGVFTMKNIFLRPVTEADCKLLFEWRNELTTRQNSFNQNEIAYAEHKAWFEKILSSKDETIFILMNGDAPVGQIRLSQKEIVLLSYSIAPKFRAQGYGKALIMLAENIVTANFEKKIIRAEVKKNNVASQMIFKKLSYNETESKDFYIYEKLASFSNIEKVLEVIDTHTGGGYCS